MAPNVWQSSTNLRVTCPCVRCLASASESLSGACCTFSSIPRGAQELGACANDTHHRGASQSPSSCNGQIDPARTIRCVRETVMVGHLLAKRWCDNDGDLGPPTPVAYPRYRVTMLLDSPSQGASRHALHEYGFPCYNIWCLRTRSITIVIRSSE